MWRSLNPPFLLLPHGQEMVDVPGGGKAVGKTKPNLNIAFLHPDLGIGVYWMISLASSYQVW